MYLVTLVAVAHYLDLFAGCSVTDSKGGTHPPTFSMKHYPAATRLLCALGRAGRVCAVHCQSRALL